MNELLEEEFPPLLPQEELTPQELPLNEQPEAFMVNYDNIVNALIEEEIVPLPIPRKFMELKTPTKKKIKKKTAKRVAPSERIVNCPVCSEQSVKKHLDRHFKVF